MQAELKPLFVREGLMYVPSCQSPVLKARWYLQLAFRAWAPPARAACLSRPLCEPVILYLHACLVLFPLFWGELWIMCRTRGHREFDARVFPH